MLIVGAGSLGTLYGAALARAGCDVQLLARPAHAEAIASAGGVRVEDPAGDWTARLRATADPSRVEPADTVLLLTQVQDGPAALAPLGHVRAGVRLALSLQNGGGTERALEAWCGSERVASATSMVGATLLAPGRIAHSAPGLTYLGPPDARIEALAARLEAGGLTTVVTDRIRSAQWSKLVNAAATMTLTALPRLPLHVAFSDPDTSVAYVELVREGVAVAEASGVELEDWPGMVPVATLCRVSLAAAARVLVRRGRALEAAGATTVVTSMLRSVETGRPLEIAAVHGFLCAEAARHGVGVPRLRLALAMLGALDRLARG